MTDESVAVVAFSYDISFDEFIAVDVDANFVVGAVVSLRSLPYG